MTERRNKRQAPAPDESVNMAGDSTEEAANEGTEPTEESPAPKQTEFTVNGKHTAPGHLVHYTTRLGIVHRATVASLKPQDDGTTQADLDAEVDGRWQRFAGVPHSVDGGINTWDHVPSKESQEDRTA